MVNNPHDVAAFGEEDVATDLLEAIQGAGNALPSSVVDFTFRLPRELLDELNALAREHRCTTNALVAALVDVGLRGRGRQGIAERFPDYVRYLRRGRARAV